MKDVQTNENEKQTLKNDDFMTQKTKRSTEGVTRKHMTVRIPRGITEAIEEFLKTEQAAKMGFDSKADVVTTAVRRLLTEYGYYNIEKRKEQKQQEPAKIT